MMDPTMPACWYSGRFRVVFVNNPAARIAIFMATTFVIDITKLVFTNTLSMQPSKKSCVDCITVSPSKNLLQKTSHVDQSSFS